MIYSNHIYANSFLSLFFNDILVYSKSYQDSLLHLRKVLNILQELVAKDTKCHFGCTSNDYLGHIMSKDDVYADLDKIWCMLDWP